MGYRTAPSHARTFLQYQADFSMRPAAQDPLPQTVRMVHAAFDALMDVLEAQQALAERGRGADPNQAAAAAAAALGASESAVAFQEATALELMAMGAPCLGFNRTH